MLRNSTNRLKSTELCTERVTEGIVVTKSCLTLRALMDCSAPGCPVLRYLPAFTQTRVHGASGATNPLVLRRPLSLLHLAQHQGLSTESALPSRRPQYWSFSFSISPSSEYSGLISFRMDWLDLLAAQGTLNGLLQHHSSKASFFSALNLLYGPTLISIHGYWKNNSFD